MTAFDRVQGKGPLKSSSKFGDGHSNCLVWCSVVIDVMRRIRFTTRSHCVMKHLQFGCRARPTELDSVDANQDSH